MELKVVCHEELVNVWEHFIVYGLVQMCLIIVTQEGLWNTSFKYWYHECYKCLYCFEGGIFFLILNRGNKIVWEL